MRDELPLKEELGCVRIPVPAMLQALFSPKPILQPLCADWAMMFIVRP